MTEEELQEIEQRATLASPGPWTVYRCSFADEYGDGSNPAACGLNGRSFDCSYDECHHTIDRLEDAEFMAHARTDVPALVAEIRRLQKLVEEVQYE